MRKFLIPAMLACGMLAAMPTKGFSEQQTESADQSAQTQELNELKAKAESLDAAIKEETAKRAEFVQSIKEKAAALKEEREKAKAMLSALKSKKEERAAIAAKIKGLTAAKE